MENQNQPDALYKELGEAINEDLATMTLSASEVASVDLAILDKAMQDQNFVELIKAGANLALLKAMTNYPKKIIKGCITEGYSYITFEGMGHPISKEEESKKIVNIALARIRSLSQAQARTNLPIVQEFMKERFFKQESTYSLAKKFGLEVNALAELRKTCPKEAQARTTHKNNRK